MISPRNMHQEKRSLTRKLADQPYYGPVKVDTRELTVGCQMSVPAERDLMGRFSMPEEWISRTDSIYTLSPRKNGP